MYADIDSSMLSGKWDGRVSARGKLGQLFVWGDRVRQCVCLSVYAAPATHHQLLE